MNTQCVSWSFLTSQLQGNFLQSCPLPLQPKVRGKNLLLALKEGRGQRESRSWDAEEKEGLMSQGAWELFLYFPFSLLALRPINSFSVPLPSSQKPPPHFFFSLKRMWGKDCIPENLVSASMTLERNQFHKHTSQQHLLATDTNHGASLLPLFSQPSMGSTYLFSSDQCITRCNSLTQWESCLSPVLNYRNNSALR